MKNQEALEVISSVLNRTPINKAEQAGLNAALEALRERVATAVPGRLDRPDDGQVEEFPRT